MHHKGRSFIGAALLLRRQGGYEYVSLHLLCQGIEIILKSLLLYHDYDKYKPLIKKQIGHDLEKAADNVVGEFGRETLKPEPLLELKGLNNLYKDHRLRYGNGYDLLVDPKTILSERVLRRMSALLRIIDRHISW